MDYDFQKIEKKWQDKWDQEKTFQAKSDYTLPKYYVLVEFPYPSANGLHVGHPRSYTALDIVARKRRLQGFNVLYCMGWDAFGLPTENFAIKNNIHPEVVTNNNIQNFKKQLKSIGLSFDWDREVNTTSAEYYKWTQWIFLQMFKKGLAYKKETNVNWCTSCNCVLANEEVVNNLCERCGSEVINKKKSQWMLKITAYGDRLIDDLKFVDYILPVKQQQTNWIGRSFGANIFFKTNTNSTLVAYTTRPDTIFGVTYMAISIDHPILKEEREKIKNFDEILEYIKKTEKKSEFERSNMIKEKTGVKIDGVFAINPANNTPIPIFVADYVLSGYGSGAIMAVPAHDKRDFEFAKKFNIPIISVIKTPGKDENELNEDTENGTLLNSDFLNQLNVKQAKERIINWLEEKGFGKRQKNFKLRDWIFARQRYWGEPIPIIHCEKCGAVPVPEEELPIKLPKIDDFSPRKDGKSPLAGVESFVNVPCPKCGSAAKRETDTMPQWAGSSWYYLRYCSPHCDFALADAKDLNYWMPVDWYNGGMEHTTLHLLYSRFWHKFLYDIGVVEDIEPYKKRTSHGMILGQNGEKMSKSRQNVINPDDIIAEYGADTFRLYEMFMGDFEKMAPWSSESIKGCNKFLKRVFNLQEFLVQGPVREELNVLINQTIKKVSQDIETTKFNTAVATMMTFVNKIYETQKITTQEFRIFLILLNPFAPHITEELFTKLKLDHTISQEKWPKFDNSKLKEEKFEMIIQINGKIKSKLILEETKDNDSVIALAKSDDKIKNILQNCKILKTIVVPNKIVNFVTN